jgi:4-nitrophenyl phosphatase
MGIDATEAEVLSAGTVTTSYLAEHHADDPAFVVGHPGLVEQFEAADLPVTTDPDVAELLVASYDQQFNYDDMTAAYRVAADGSPFIGTDPDVVIPTDDGIALGSGAIINAVAGVLERDPDRVLGKPSPEAVGMAGEALGVPLEDCLVVGDRLNTDLALGERASMTTVLVRTGVTTDAQLEQSALTPDFVLDSLADIEAVFD